MHRLPSLSTPELRLSAGVCYSVVAVQIDRSIYSSCHVVSHLCFVLLSKLVQPNYVWPCDAL